MKRNTLRILSLILCLMLVCPAAMAQEAPYIIGRTSAGLLSNALQSGHILTAAAQFDIELDAEVLGMSEEDAGYLELLNEVLDQATITGGFGLLDEGMRLTLEAALEDEAGENVSVDAAVNITLDGLSVESDLIAGRRLSAQWETLLALAGFDEMKVALFSEGKELVRGAMNMGLEQVIENFVSSFGPMFDTYSQLVMPYIQTAAEFVYSLPMEISENLNEEGYPPTATEIAIMVTEKDLGELLMQLCDQAEQDAALKQLIDPILMMAADGLTSAQLIGELRTAAAAMTDTAMPLCFFLGMNEADVPLYLEATLLDEASEESFYAGFYCYEDAELGRVVELSGGLYDLEGSPYVNLYVSGSHLGNPADPNVHDIQFLLSVSEEETPLAELSMAYTSLPAADSELPAYDVTTSYSMYAADGTQIVSTGQGRNGQTSAGGEFGSAASQADTYVANSLISATASVETLVEPTADGGITGRYRLSESMPYAGINSFTLDTALGSEAYDPAQTEALTPLELEKLTNDEMNALTQDVLNVLLDEKLMKALEILPIEVVEMIAGTAQAE